MKNVFTIEPNEPFLEKLACELWHRSGGDGFKLSRYLVLLPTRRACRRLAEIFGRLAGDRPILLPRMRPLGEVDEDEIGFSDEGDFDAPAAIAPMRRLMLLTQHVQKRDPSLSWDQAAQGAEALSRFLDQVQLETCDTGLLSGLVDEQELAQHWQQTVRFLEIVTVNWPLVLQDEGCLDPVERRNAIMTAQAEVWKIRTPSFPVIAAGSTGSIPATAILLDVIAGMPDGSVILPGLDRDIDNEAWSDVEETHPQNHMKRLLELMQVQRESVQDWGGSRSCSHRVRLLNECMRPSSSTEAWRHLKGALDHTAIDGLQSLVLDHPQEEAQVIALRILEIVRTTTQTAALVTPDRSLAVRVAVLLRRWGIDVDDSAGVPLAMLAIGSFLNLVLTASQPHAGAVDLLALLKHPFAACGQSPAACRAYARSCELELRSNQPQKFELIRSLLAPLTQAWHRPMRLEEHIVTHISVCEAIASSDTESGASRLWHGESGIDAALWLEEWRTASRGFPVVARSDYKELFGSLSSTKVLRSGRPAHPRVAILGLLEARSIDADLMILAGMNEGIWPPDAGYDPWMSRPMRKKFKLPAPEFRIGLSAHDFVQLASAPQVMITRSLRVNGTPTVPSRFILQLEAVVRAASLNEGVSEALSSALPWKSWVRALDLPEHIVPCARPTPRPPVSCRPTKLSVTEVTTWLRNPYAIYARHILKLVKLDELDAELDASDRGIIIHAALEAFVQRFPQQLLANSEECLLEIGREIFAKAGDHPRVAAFWWARFIDIASWFVEHERARTDLGYSHLVAELSGALEINGLKLRGRADRIDRLDDGRIAIIDYKTGAAPTKAEVVAGIEPQLQLLALIAQSGGFEGLGSLRVGSLDYWILKGGAAGCKVVSFTKEIDEMVSEAEAGIKNLIEVFSRVETPYEAVPKPRFHPRFNDYAHLSRLSEWGRTVGEL